MYLATLVCDNQIDDLKFGEILVRSMALYSHADVVLSRVETLLMEQEYGPGRGIERERVEEIMSKLRSTLGDERTRPGGLRDAFALALAYGLTQITGRGGPFERGVYAWETGMCIRYMDRNSSG
jgi:hypothetical protein